MGKKAFVHRVKCESYLENNNEGGDDRPFGRNEGPEGKERGRKLKAKISKGRESLCYWQSRRVVC